MGDAIGGGRLARWRTCSLVRMFFMWFFTVCSLITSCVAIPKHM